MNTVQKHILPLLLLAVPVGALAQSLPASQPAFVRIIREEVKLGRNADHAKLESGWPAAFERAKSPDFYLGMESLTTNEAWFIIPSASFAAQGESLAREREPALDVELTRLQRADAELITNWRAIEARARPELSHGAYPDLGKERFWQVTLFRMRPGYEAAFAAAAKSYGAAADRAGSTSGFRVYQVIAGMPMPTYIVFSSVASYGEFDKIMAAGEATMKAMAADDQPIGKKFEEGLVNSETFRLRLNPEMSYVPKETRASDLAFWSPKSPALAKPAVVAAAKTAPPKR